MELTIEQKQKVLRARELGVTPILIEAALLDGCLDLLIADTVEANRAPRK